MKTFLMAHPSHFRTVMTIEEAERLTHHGWRQLSDSQLVKPNAMRQRKHREKLKQSGCHRFTAHLPADLFDELLSLKKPGETNDDFLTRVVLLLRVL